MALACKERGQYLRELVLHLEQQYKKKRRYIDRSDRNNDAKNIVPTKMAFL